MRWLLADPQIAEERAWKQHVVAATDRWWQAFQANSGNIATSFSRNSKFDIVQFMHDNLGRLHPDLCWEYGPARHTENQRSGGHRLVITPEANHWLRPVTNYLLSKAPAIPNWEFYAHRPPESVDHVYRTVEARRHVKVQQAGIEARIGRNRKIDLLYTFPKENWTEEKAHAVAFQITETLMGEETLDTWIGGIDVVDAREPGHRWLTLDRGQSLVASLAHSLREQLPAQPLWRIDKGQAKWSNYQMEPERDWPEYPYRSDLIFGTTCDFNLVEGYLSGKLFDSRCHSRHQEIFCYLKIDATEVPDSRRVDFRANLEDPLDAALQQEQVGGSIGGGSGLMYSYIDLSLTHVNQGLAIMRKVLPQCGAPLRTWLIFFDSQYSREWAGLYPQTPPPPVFAEDDEE